MLAGPAPRYPLFRGVMRGWDNTPRVEDRAHCFVNAERANYARWLQAVVGQTRASRPADERIVFINAWNGGAKAVISSRMPVTAARSWRRPRSP